jgi:LruC domain-containing protein
MKQKTSFPAFLLGLGILGAIVVSCQKLDSTGTPKSNAISDMKVSPDFKFRTTQVLKIRILTLDNADAPVPNMRVNIYTDIPENNGSLILSGITDANGLFSSDYKIATGIDSLAVSTPAVGFCNMQKVKVAAGELNFTLGGKVANQGFKSGGASSFKSVNSNFYPLGTYNALGVPNYLALPNDIIDAAMLKDINATLPDYMNATVGHPQYFVAANEHNLVLNDPSNVWVTFVSEGAGYRNVLGYYTYNINSPPATAAAIDSIHIIFPNVSFLNSGGGLVSGNRVHLGTFPPGTEIGWVLISDGFRNGIITNGNYSYYSDINLNPETDVNKKQHTTLLNDIGRGKFLLSFEDLRRDAGSDNDFNDAVFYVTADPVQAIATQNIPLPNYTQVDGDHDGIPDTFDDYPADATKAFNNFYPSENNVGTLAFEDFWPSKGDYDFNDMVLDYNFNQVTNGQNKVVQIKATIILKAFGAGYENGFGIQLPVSPGQIASITGTDIKESYIVQNPNGTEAGQSKATIIIFDNAYKEMTHPGGSSIGVNTTPGAPYVQPKVLNLTINLTTAVSLSTMGLPPYNPFLIIQGERSREIHLIDNPPTDLANTDLLGTSDDNSNPATGRYYVSAGNLPFAIDIAGPFDYPVEKVQVTQAHLKFFPWGESGGAQYYDWFKPVSGYRNTSNIYSH